ncbi:MAG: hypothetical protein GXY83_15705 [Rhodopirellula sp.]|nr:hypothetical protein [Rhodopirellula sp.]
MAITRLHGDYDQLERTTAEAARAEAQASNRIRERKAVEKQQAEQAQLAADLEKILTREAAAAQRQQASIDAQNQRQIVTETGRDRRMYQEHDLRLQRQAALKKLDYNIKLQDRDAKRRQMQEFAANLTPDILDANGINDETDPDGSVRSRIDSIKKTIAQRPGMTEPMYERLMQILQTHATGAVSQQEKETRLREHLELQKQKEISRVANAEFKKVEGVYKAKRSKIALLKAEREALEKSLENVPPRDAERRKSINDRIKALDDRIYQAMDELSEAEATMHQLAGIQEEVVPPPPVPDVAISKDMMPGVKPPIPPRQYVPDEFYVNNSGQPKDIKHPNKLDGGPTSRPQGKPLDRETALEFYRQAGGDKEKARQLAIEAGYQL